MNQMLKENSISQKYAASATGFIILNPAAGNGDPEEIKQILQTSLGQEQYELYETTGDESLPEVVRTAVNENDFAWIAAIGGDGTVSQVINGLVGTDIPLAILPGGTGNVLAQDLEIPQDIEAACQLLLGEGKEQYIDAIQVDDHYFVHQIGIGLESLTMESTSSEHKNRWGLAAYLWTAVKEAFGWQPHQFTLTIDGQKYHRHASELALANAGKIGAFGLKWENEIRPNDGRIDVVLIRAKSLADYLQVIWTLITGQQRKSNYFDIFSAFEEIKVETVRQLPVHGDGEICDILPFTAVVVPEAVKVIVPR